jgi:hypothetical protein
VVRITLFSGILTGQQGWQGSGRIRRMPAARLKHTALTVDITAAAVNVLVVSVLAGFIGQSADPFFPAVLALGLSALLLVHRKFPVPALLVSLVFIDVLWA